MAETDFDDSNGYVADGMVHIDPETLAQSLAEFGPGTGRGGDHDLSASVQIVIERASNVFNVSGVGLMLIGSEDQELRYVASTGATARVFELAQIEVGAGPCIDSFVLGDLVRDEDMRSEPRWSELCDRLGDEPVRAVLGVPARVNGETVGTLNAFCERPHAWDESEVAALVAYGHVLEGMLSSALAARDSGQLVEQLQHALENRVAIERAVGLVMGRDRVDAVSAFNALRGQARSERRRVRDIADELLAAIDDHR